MSCDAASVSDFDRLCAEVRQFVDERDWRQFHDPKSLFIALAGEVGEVAELLQWLPADQASNLIRDEPLNTQVRDELGDVLIYLIQLAASCNVELLSAARAKLESASVRYTAATYRGVAPKRPRPPSGAVSAD